MVTRQDLGIPCGNPQAKSQDSQAEIELQQITTALSHAVEGISRLDPQGRYQMVNPAYARAVGYQPEDMIGMDWQKTVHPEDLDKMLLAYQQMLSTGKVDVEGRGIRKDGTIFYKQITMVANYSPDQQLMGHYCFMKDITERVQLQAERGAAVEELKRSERKFRAIFNSMFQLIGVLTPTGMLVEANQTALDVIATDRADVIGQPFWLTPWWTHSPTLQTQLQDAITRSAQGETVQFESEHIWANGQKAFVDFSLKPVVNETGTVIMLILEGRDITDRKQTEIKLRQQEVFLKSIYNGTEQAVFVLDITAENNFRYTHFNPVSERYAGVAKEQIQGKTPEEAFGEVVGSELRQNYQRCLQAGTSIRYEERIEFETQSIWTLTTLVPLRNEQGIIYRIIGTAIDITDRKQAEEALQESEQRLQSMLDNSTAVIFVKDTQGRYMMINRSYETLFHLDRNQVKGKTDYDIFPKEIAEAFRANDREVMAAGIPLEKEEVAPQDDGMHTFLSIKFPLFDAAGAIYAVCGMATDISERKRVENERKQTEIELQHQKQDLARSNAELQQFAYVASHDLQEPLRMITSYLELLKRRYSNQLDDKADQFINFAVDGAVRMQTLINDLLKYSRVGTHDKLTEPVDCVMILHNAQRNLQIAIAESQAMITYDPLPLVNADATQLTQLFQNLLSNAIKFRQPGIPPCIHVSCKLHNSKWLFSVKDNGIGIEQQYLERIFLIFQRLHSRAEYPGTGIGLAVCKKIVERYGGNLWVESQPVQGSTFYFTMPK